DAAGAFTNRKQLKDVSRLGPKAFEQAAGFLKVMNGDNPLDGSAVHPESYSVVERIVADTGRDVTALIGDSRFIRSLKAEQYVDDTFGLPTITDILQELEKPGRDPRPEFKTAEFQDGVETIKDLRQNMVLEGVVTNVTHFGAFVDVGVHQDGLVHISAMSHQFIDDPSKLVKAGDIVKVKVMDVDVARNRIALSMRLDDEAQPADRDQNTGSNHRRNSAPRRDKNQGSAAPAGQTAMASLLQEAMKKKGGRL
ncbi:MAG: S1 RNA-binding domain-containing protein, partial [Xanthomonadales bacterium]|nr:S1 RNA-binding domain-containing protein [Xanthomonadales bacterium]